MKKIEALIAVLRRHDFTLDLSSTVTGSPAKYSAIFWHFAGDECSVCESHIPNDWVVYEHADTVKEVILKAAHAIIKTQALEDETEGLI